jgi:hypothetical protein
LTLHLAAWRSSSCSNHSRFLRRTIGLRDATFRIVVPIRFNEIPPQHVARLQDLERRKLLECYEADREELEYQRRKAAYRKVEPPTEVDRMPEGCLEAKRQDAERQRREVDALR